VLGCERRSGHIAGESLKFLALVVFDSDLCVQREALKVSAPFAGHEGGPGFGFHHSD
jgi:hypothetical protein